MTIVSTACTVPFEIYEIKFHFCSDLPSEEYIASRDIIVGKERTPLYPHIKHVFVSSHSIHDGNTLRALVPYRIIFKDGYVVSYGNGRVLYVTAPGHYTLFGIGLVALTLFPKFSEINDESQTAFGRKFEDAVTTRAAMASQERTSRHTPDVEREIAVMLDKETKSAFGPTALHEGTSRKHGHSQSTDKNTTHVTAADNTATISGPDLRESASSGYARTQRLSYPPTHMTAANASQVIPSQIHNNHFFGMTSFSFSMIKGWFCLG